MADASTVPALPWTLHFHDGSANTFRFHQEDGRTAQFVYDPVTPEQSSSGIYSGGSPNAGPLDLRTAEELWRRVLALEGDASAHWPSRDKGTGAFRIEINDGAREFIVRSGPALEAFLDFVKPFRAA